MNPKAKRILLRPIPYLFSDAAGNFIARLWSKQLREELGGTATDKFLDLLLAGMDLAFALSKGYRKNIIRVTFKDWTALRDFLFFGDQDILDSLLENKVEVDGNPNYIFKFGFMARDLGRRLGVG